MTINKSHKKARFTLIEIMLAICIGALFITIVIVLYPKHKISTKLQVSDPRQLEVENALRFYRLDNGFYPSTNQGLQALLKKPATYPIPKHWSPYLKYLPLSNNGKPYRYKSLNHGQSFKLFVEK